MKSDRLRMNRSVREAAAPAWMVTYADLVTLLLCLFVGLFSMSAIKPDLFQIAIGSVRGALRSNAPGAEPAAAVGSLAAAIEREMAGVSQTPTENAAGGLPWAAHWRTAGGVAVRLSGPVVFDREGSELKADARELVMRLAATISEREAMVKVTGYCNDETPHRSTERALSFTRAAGVAAIFEKAGVPARAIRVEALADGEPLLNHAYTDVRKAMNRGVVIELEEVVRTRGDSAGNKKETG
jgi:chemotaxis protein MotB